MLLNQKKHILDYWLNLEFFLPSDCPREEEKYRKNDQLGTILPWIRSNNVRDSSRDDEKVKRYDLYLCLFKKSEISSLAQEYLPQCDDFDWDENPRTQGYTCYAKISVNEHGSYIEGSFSASSLPWALGKLTDYSLNELNSQNLKTALDYLSEEISEIIIENPEVNDGSILKLVVALKNWANIESDSDLIKYPVCIEVFEVPQKKESKKKDQDEPDLEEVEPAQDNKEIMVLNSFYINDLEKVAKSPSQNILNYLSLKANPINDVNSEKGDDILHGLLEPSKQLKSRWPQNFNHHLNMMQQVSANSIFDKLKDGGIFSVNGPPGTGKSTLLREFIAENVTRRASVLAKYDRAKDAFLEQKVPYKDKDGTMWYMPMLQPELCGFEMLLCTANNKAAENISRELPKKESISSPTSYLRGIANQLAAKQGFNDQLILEEKNSSWGLISARLGNQANCQEFVNRVFFKSKGGESRDESIEMESIWSFRDSYNGPSFKDARNEFLEQNEKIDALMQAIKSYDENKKMLDKTCLEKVENHLKSLEIEREESEKKVELRKQKIDNSKIIIKNLEEEIKTYNKLKFQSFYYSLLFFKKRSLRESDAYKNYEKEKLVLSNLKKQLRAEKSHGRQFRIEIAQLDSNMKNLTDEIRVIEKEYEEKREFVHNLESEIEKFECEWGKIDWVDEETSFECEKDHLRSFYQNEKINQEKTLLFQKALQLHEAWLCEVTKKQGGFGASVSILQSFLKGNKNWDRKVVKHLWQCLFMIVPLISSTFASVGRLFNGLKSNDLGWLFIDEAGQTVPQAAVGAIWRCKRAVVIGDPKQLKPVFTVPFPLMQHLGMPFYDDVSNNKEFEHFCPVKSSVQKLADTTNTIGAHVSNNGITEWVACPLRVHRRCQSPMFEISNEISYKGSMIQVVPPLKQHFIESCWYDVQGYTCKKQYVAEQGEFLLEKLKEVSQKYDTFKSIFVITPFKAVERSLKELLRINRNCFFSPKVNINTWINESIGTIHTFQGKEADIVFLILGSDNTAKGMGAANWAAQEPNLLNVAVTRAKKYIYVIGDSDLWRQKAYFNTLYTKLKENTKELANI